jgi:hypothetical protein
MYSRVLRGVHARVHAVACSLSGTKRRISPHAHIRELTHARTRFGPLHRRRSPSVVGSKVRVCAFVCLCVWVCVCVRLCVCVCLVAFVSLCESTCVWQRLWWCVGFVCVSLRVFAFAFARASVCVNACVCAYACVCPGMCAFVCARVHLFLQFCIFVRECVCAARGGVGSPMGTFAVFILRRADGRRVRAALALAIGRFACVHAGATWTSRTTSAPWAARSSHTSVIDAAGAIYVLGGQGSTRYQDVWASTDGGA